MGDIFVLQNGIHRVVFPFVGYLDGVFIQPFFRYFRIGQPLGKWQKLVCLLRLPLQLQQNPAGHDNT